MSTPASTPSLAPVGALLGMLVAGLGCGTAPIDAPARPPGEVSAGPVDAGPGAPPDAAPPAPALIVPAGALDPLYAALARAEAGDARDGRVAVVVFGDSHTAGDHLTGWLRRELGARFGVAGRGFVLAGRPPIRHYYQRDVRYGSDGRWAAELGGKRDAAPPFGMAGVRAHATRKSATAWVASCERCAARDVARFDVFYLRRTDSGKLAYRLDDGPWRIQPTRLDRGGPPAPAPAVLSIPAAAAPHKLSLRPAGGGAVELFGVALERGTPGVVVDALGVVGRRLAHLRSWDWADVTGPQLAARAPALVVLQYGTNEADQRDLDLAALARQHDEVIALIRQHAPAAAILVLGAPDMAARAGGRACDKLPPPVADATGDAGVPPECQWRTPPALLAVTEVQRAAAARNHVAFFDTLAAMGGAEQMDVFLHMDPPLAYSDHVHFTQPGYELWGQRLLAALLADYDRWKLGEAGMSGGDPARSSP